MTPEQIEMAKVIAEYDGWLQIPEGTYNECHRDTMWFGHGGKFDCYHDITSAQKLHYLTSLDWLHPVAMRLIDDIISQMYIINSTWRDRYLPIPELKSHKWRIEQCCTSSKGEEGYTALFESCYNAITFLNELKSEQ